MLTPRPHPLALPPPVVDGDVAELHPRDGLRPGAWWACHHPDRMPRAELTAFDRSCSLCLAVLEQVQNAAGRAAPKLVMHHRSRGGVELPHNTLVVHETHTAARTKGRR